MIGKRIGIGKRAQIETEIGAAMRETVGDESSTAPARTPENMGHVDMIQETEAESALAGEKETRGIDAMEIVTMMNVTTAVGGGAAGAEIGMTDAVAGGGAQVPARVAVAVEAGATIAVTQEHESEGETEAEIVENVGIAVGIAVGTEIEIGIEGVEMMMMMMIMGCPAIE